jgi:RNA polymerase sigma-70 factor (sigma-E family)
MRVRLAGPRAVGTVPRAPAEMTSSPETFAEFYAESHASMTRLAYLLTGSKETAQDLTQDCFVRLHAAWPRVSNPEAYLRASVTNASRSYHRRRARERRASSQRPYSAELGAEELFDALAALPYRQRAALVLRFWHDLGEAEIAKVIGCRPGTVGSLIHRALEQLRRVIER